MPDSNDSNGTTAAAAPRASSRAVILLPLRGEPRVVPLDMGVYEKCAELCGGRVMQVPAAHFRGDRYRIGLATHMEAPRPERRNALASRLLGGAGVYGPAVVARRRASDASMFDAPHPSDRDLTAFSAAEARTVLAALAEDGGD